jgi:hypothetical protein
MKTPFLEKRDAVFLLIGLMAEGVMGYEGWRK